MRRATHTRRIALAAILAALLSCALPQAASAVDNIDLASRANVKFTSPAGTGVTSLADAGDLNGDKRPDLLVGNNSASNNGRTYSGSVYVVFGQSTPTDVDLSALGTRGYRIDGPVAGAGAGGNVDNAGDVNGDGIPDQLIGATGISSGFMNSGTVFVVYGKSSTGTIDLATLGAGGYEINGGGSEARAGYSLANAGDVNKDGIPDQLISAQVNGYYAFVVYGKRSDSPITLSPSMGSNGYGILASGPTAVANAGDVNRDGRPDQLVGAYLDSGSGRYQSGSAAIVYGKTGATNLDTANLGSAGYRLEGAVAGEGAGRTVANAGDVNRDGVPDQMVGAPGADNNGRTDSGSAYVVYGKSGTAATDLASLGVRGYRIDGAAGADALGTSLASIGDVNGDGRPDQIVGAPGADNNGRSGSGSVYVAYGRPTPPLSFDVNALGTRGYRIDGASAGAGAGSRVARSPDLDGDGVPDPVIGANGDALAVFSPETNPPTSQVSHRALAGTASQHYDATARRLFFNPLGRGGSFRLENTPTDAGSGVASVDYGQLTTTGFSGASTRSTAGPWRSGVYSYGAANTTAPSPLAVTVADRVGNRTTRSVSFVRDVAGPTLGLSAPAAARRIATGQALAATAADSGAGMRSVEWRYCPGSTCSYAASTGIAAPDRSAPYSATWASQPRDGDYTLLTRATDNVGNTTDRAQAVTVDNGRAGGPTPPGTSPPRNGSPVGLLTRSVRIDRRGNVKLRVRCGARTRCRSRVTIFYEVATKKRNATKARTSARRTGKGKRTRKRKIVLARKTVTLSPGATGTVKVHISRRARRRIGRNKARRCRISVTTGGRTVTRKLLIKPQRRR